jgi:glutamine synthetase
MSKPYLDAPGSGMHVHVSLYDQAGNNLLDSDGQRPLRHAVAGCLELLPHCMPIFSANHNAFRRYGAMVNSASKASWGFEDRDACIRIPESDGSNLRIEHRLAGADANPYLVLAAILSGMEHGLDQAREPIPSLNEDRSSGIGFPKDMLTAVAAMESHEVVKAKLGSEFVFVYCENKRQDHLQFMHDISAREYRWFL